MDDLKLLDQSMDFSFHLILSMEAQLERGRSKLDPKEFRTLYIKKISQDQNKKLYKNLSFSQN